VSVYASSNQLGDFRAGFVASVLATIATVAIGALMALGIAIGGYYLLPNIRNLDKLAGAVSSVRTARLFSHESLEKPKWDNSDIPVA